MSDQGARHTEQLAEFLAAVSAYDDELSALRGAIEHATEALEAEVGAVVRRSGVLASIGFPSDGVPADHITQAAAGRRDSIHVDGVGDCSVLTVPIGGSSGELLVGRHGSQGFSSQEGGLLRSMARVLQLTLGNIRIRTRERERQSLLERLSRIQRSISHHAPLQEVLDSITAGARELLGDEVAGLLTVVPGTDGMLVVSNAGVDRELARQVRRRRVGEGAAGRALAEERVVVIEDYRHDPNSRPAFVEAGVRAAMAAPYYEAGRPAGSLVVASHQPGRRYSDAEREALQAFAEHVGLALSDARRAEQVERARRNPLTGLRNRNYFREQLDRRMSDADGTQAVICLDLDGFRSVNDSLGHDMGDQLLRELARRLESVVGAEDALAHLGGDEFGVLTRSEQADSVTTALREALSAPFELAGRKVTMTASVGIAQGHAAARDLLRNADLAMYRAKDVTGTSAVVYNEQMRTELLARLELEADLARALEGDELEVHFQPIARVRDGHVLGMEALVRWRHPSRGLLAPASFISLAENSGLIGDLTRRVLELSLQTLSNWGARGRPLQLAVNLSATSLSDHQLVGGVAELLTRLRLPGAMLRFEITEDVLMSDPEQAELIFQGLGRLGVGFSIDDFGTGHSSLTRLKELPIGELKIDRAFVTDLTSGDNDAAIVRSTINLAHDLGLEVVAEGVEDDGTWHTLRQLGCDRLQGYHLSKPLPAEECWRWLRRWDARSEPAEGPGVARYSTRPSRMPVATAAARSDTPSFS